MKQQETKRQLSTSLAHAQLTLQVALSSS